MAAAPHHPPASTMPSDSPGMPRWQVGLITFGVASILGLLLASQWVLATRAYGRAIPWPAALFTQLRESWLWALLVPVVFAVSRRFPLQRGDWLKSMAVHSLAALLTATTYSALNTSATTWLTPPSLRPAFGPRRPPPPRTPSEDREHDKDRDRDRDRDKDKDKDKSTTAEASPAPPPRNDPGSWPNQFWFGFSTRLHLNIFTYALVVAIWHWSDHQRRLRIRERQAQELSRQLAEARLQALRMQLNPHFLFNTLNAIATLVHRDPEAADEMIACLSDFLRLTLNAQNAPENPLRTELDFARRYLDIEKVRFGERLSVTEDIAADCLGVLVPTLVLQPLLENAIRHGIERSEEKGAIQLAARRDADSLVLQVGNTGPVAIDPRPRGNGVGLANTRARLLELHGDRAAITLRHRPNGGLDVEIRLPCASTATPAPSGSGSELSLPT